MESYVLYYEIIGIRRQKMLNKKNVLLLCILLSFSLLLSSCGGRGDAGSGSGISSESLTSATVSTDDNGNNLKLTGYVYKPKKEFKQSETLNFLITDIPFNDESYEAVNNATIKVESKSIKSTKTNVNGAFALTTGLTEGEHSIIIDPATSTNAGDYSAQVEIFAVGKQDSSQQPTSIKVVPVRTTVPLGKKRQFRVVAKHGNAYIIPPSGVQWSVEGGIGTIDENGIFTATNAGEGIVIATYGQLSSFSIVRVIGHSDSTGNLHGFVTDGTNPISEIIIKVDGINSIGITNSNGEYLIPDIPAGTYRVSAVLNNVVLAEKTVKIIDEETTECNFVINPPPIHDDGGYIVTGVTFIKGAGKGDVWVLRIDSSGNLIWDKTFGGPYYDEGHSIQYISDGGYIVAGFTGLEESCQDGTDCWVIKLDPNGNLLWDKTAGQYGVRDEAYSTQQTSDGGYIVTGIVSEDKEIINANNNVLTLKFDSIGNLIWDKIFSGTYDDHAYSIQQTSDGGYIIGGSTNSKGAGNMDAWIVKLDPSGDPMWDRTFGDILNDTFFSIQQITGENKIPEINVGYIAAGYTEGGYLPGRMCVLVVKFDSNGSIIWNKTFSKGIDSCAKLIQNTLDGGYIIAGWTSLNDIGNFDAWILKLDSSGNLLWDKTFGGMGQDDAYSVQQTFDGGYIVAGRTTKYGGLDCWIFKLDSEGNLIWEKTYYGGYAHSIQQVPVGK